MVNWPLLFQGLAGMGVGVVWLMAWFAPLYMTIRELWEWFRDTPRAPHAPYSAWYDCEVFPLMDEDPRSWELSQRTHAKLRHQAIREHEWYRRRCAQRH